MTAHIPVRSVLADREMELGPETEPAKALTHWRLLAGEDDIAWLLLDRAGESANTLSGEVLRELDEMLDAVEERRPKALVIRSAKPSGFAAGADIREFAGLSAEEDVAREIRRAHEVVDRLDRLSVPTIAVVHGHCLGGGLELALACDNRIAIEGAKLGFPEVMLGLHPGLGGTFRLTGLIDQDEAMTMMLTGKSMHAGRAKKIGLVDAVIPERHVKNAVRDFAGRKPKAEHRSLKGRALSLDIGRNLAARRMRSMTAERAREAHYPAPYRLIELWQEHGDDAADMQEAEIASFSRLLVTPQAQNLIRAFFLREKLRGLAKTGDHTFAHVHVVGAGTMGGDIAAWCASRGLRVTIADLDPQAIARALGRANAFFEKKLHTGIERRDARDRLIPDFSGDGVRHADVVIEAVAEKTEVKAKVFADILAKAKPSAILATNTSSIPLKEISAHFEEPGRLVGLHFFNPVTKMELVEVVSDDFTNDEAVARARAFCGRISRLPAPVRSVPGFLVNRALTPYLAEAFVMIDEGIPKETIDKAARDFGMPMGPIELADRVGLDIGLSVARMLKERSDDPLPEIPAWLTEKVAAGKLGVKTGEGIYSYDEKGKPERARDVPDPAPEAADRLILPLLNTCVRCLRENVVADEDVLDGAMIFGTGFAPFRGGPMKYARDRGIEDVVDTLERFKERYGPRFAPDPGWSELGRRPSVDRE